LSTAPATLKPAPATWPASRIAPLTGSLGAGWAGRGFREAELAVVRARGFDAAGRGAAERFAFALAAARCALACVGCRGFDAAVRLSLRRPGRERGRLPRTLGSSSGMEEKNTPVSGLRDPRRE
jgi:hypothetical protein